MNLEIKETTVLLTQSGMDVIKINFGEGFIFTFPNVTGTADLEIEHPCLFEDKEGNLQMILYWTRDEGLKFCKEILQSEPTVVSSRCVDFKGTKND